MANAIALGGKYFPQKQRKRGRGGEFDPAFLFSLLLGPHTQIVLSPAAMACCFSLRQTTEDTKPASKPSLKPASKPALKPALNSPRSPLPMKDHEWDLDAELQIAGVPESVLRRLTSEFRARTIYVSPMPKRSSYHAGPDVSARSDASELPLEGVTSEELDHEPAAPRPRPRRALKTLGVPQTPQEERELAYQYRMHRFRSRSRTSRMPSMGTELTSNNGNEYEYPDFIDYEQDAGFGGLGKEPGDANRFSSWTLAWLKTLQQEAGFESGEYDPRATPGNLVRNLGRVRTSKRSKLVSSSLPRGSSAGLRAGIACRVLAFSGRGTANKRFCLVKSICELIWDPAIRAEHFQTSNKN